MTKFCLLKLMRAPQYSMSMRVGDFYVLNKIEEFCTRLGLPFKVRAHVCLVVDEYQANLKLHTRREVKAWLKMRKGRHHVYVLLVDDGAPFHSLAHIAPKGGAHGGFGLRLMRGVSVAQSYKRWKGRNALLLAFNV